jgi:LytS/YehU family sensor histidine kinase
MVVKRKYLMLIIAWILWGVILNAIMIHTSEHENNILIVLMAFSTNMIFSPIILAINISRKIAKESNFVLK